jgi:hypothetical protein
VKKLVFGGKAVEMKTGVTYKGRPLIITPTSLGVHIREARRKEGVFVPWEVVYEVGWKMEALRKRNQA